MVAKGVEGAEDQRVSTNATIRSLELAVVKVVDPDGGTIVQ
jgi:hypothetical protein